MISINCFRRQRKSRIKKSINRKKKTEPSDTAKEGTKGEEGNDEKKPADKEKSAKEKEIKITFENIQNRIRLLTKPEDEARALGIRPNSKTLLYSARLMGRYHLWSMSMEPEKLGSAPARLSISPVNPSHLYFNSDGKKCYYLGHGQIHSMSLTDSGDRKNGPSVVPTLADVNVNFHQEKMQVFEEAWRLIRDYFYDEHYHGCDWKKVYRQFYPVIQYSQDRKEFRELLCMMVGELNASHLGAYGWGSGAAPDSFLGVDFDPVILEKENVLKIRSVLPEGPLTLVEKPAKVGEFIVSINGESVNAGRRNFAQLMHSQSNRRVKLLLNDTPEKEGAREIIIKPADLRKYGYLRYKNWVRQNADYVKDKSSGKIGYVHIREMDYFDYMKLIRDLDSEAHNRAGVVVDIRYNGGGYSAAFMLDVLYRKSFIQCSFRGRAKSGDTNYVGNRIFEKPLILLTNEHSASNAEIFSEGFRRLGLGKIVGKPTAGALIYTRNFSLLDGTRFRLPSFIVTTMDGENAELSPRPVDIEVDRPLGEAAKGIDSQLDVAVETLLKQIKRSRKKRRL